MSITSANRFLNETEMQGNALAIVLYFNARGWTKNAIAAMLGNMESESTINPGIYEGLDSTSTTNGFGLVQWTPNTKYKTWADANGYGADYGNIYGQLARIQYELDNGLQWIPTDAYPMSFYTFTRSTASVETLAQAFLHNYERPASLDQPNRSTQARKWYDFFYNETLPPVAPPTNPLKLKSMNKLLLYSIALRK